MTDSDAEARRRDVARLLAQGLDYKLLRGGSEEALRLLREARETSLTPEPLPWPWPQLTAYRLAYLMMRDARSERDVRQVLALLDEIADGGIWPDPLQYGFLCAVLVRLKSYVDDVEKLALQQRIVRTLNRMEGTNQRHGSPQGAQQTEALNIAELMTFATGVDYQLEGLGTLATSHVPAENDGFVLVGSHGVDPQVAMTWPFAGGEFDARAKNADIAFEWIEHPRVTKPVRFKLSHDFLKILPDICQGRSLGDEATLPGFHKLLLDNRRKIAALLQKSKGLSISPTDVIRHEVGQTYELHPDLRIVGLVRRAKWRPIL